jgi:hypothetical protein
VLLLLSLLTASRASWAQQVAPCSVEHAQSDAVPATAEDVRAYQECLARWREVEHASEKQSVELPRGRGMIALGAVFLTLGGLGVTGTGAAGSTFAARNQLDGVGAIVMGASGAVAGALAAVGAVVLTFGARREAKIRTRRN